MKIPMLDLKWEYLLMKPEIDAAIEKCLGHQQWILGPEVALFEEKIRSYLGTPHAIGVSSGTEALVLSLRALAITRKGREFFDRSELIATTPFTFTATGSSILRAGATPLFVDIDPNTFNLSTTLLKKAVEKNPKVVGIIPVHLYGQACAMDEIMDFSKAKGLFVLEDVAQAFGAEFKGRHVGSFGDAGAFSFFPSKNLGGFGDGGMIVTPDAKIADLLRILLKHGGRDKYAAEHLGYNARLDTLQAAILSVRLAHLDAFNEKRRQLAYAYNERLAGIDGLETPKEFRNGLHVFHQYTLRVKGGRRDALRAKLQKDEIASMVYYPVPLHQMKIFEGAPAFGSLEETVRASEEVLSLPMEPLFTETEIDVIARSIKGFFTAS